MKDGCVKFDKKSWHYRIAVFVFPILRWRDMNLCPYMRMVLASVFLLPFVAGWRKLPDVIQDNAWLVQVELFYLFLVILIGCSLFLFGYCYGCISNTFISSLFFSWSLASSSRALVFKFISSSIILLAT